MSGAGGPDSPMLRRRIAVRRLATRLMISIAIFSTVVTVLLTAGQVYIEYQRDVGDLWARVEQAEQGVLPSVVENTWLVDKERLAILLEGLVRIPDLANARVTTLTGEVLASAGVAAAEDIQLRKVLLTYRRRGAEIAIGELTLTITAEAALQRAYRRAGAILVTTTLSVFLVAVFIYFLVHRLITRHMEGLSRYARGLSLSRLDDPLALERDEARWGGDELADLVGAVNEMRVGLRDSYADLRAMTDSLERRVAERTAGLTREVEVRAKAEADLRDALDLNEKIAGKAPFGVIVFDEAGAMISVNEAAARIAGGKTDELLGLNYHDLPGWKTSGFAAIANDVFKSGAVRRVENAHLVSVFGRELDLDAHFLPIRAGGRSRLLFVFNDITDKRRAEKALRDSEQRFRDFAEAASQWFWETDAQNRYTAVDGIGPEVTGIDLSRILGRTRWELATPQDVARDPAGWAANRDDVENHRLFRNFVFAVTGDDGRVTYVSTSGKPIYDDDGTFKGYRGTAQDVTQRREMELQLIQASKMATLGEMATGVAHELNQPLNVIRLATANIARKDGKGELDPAYLTEKLGKIMQNVERAAAIIDHMRIFGRKEADAEDVDPRDVVSEALSMIGQQLYLAGIEVVTEFPESCPTVHASTVQLEQVMLNLLSNARDALQEKGGPGQRIVVRIAACVDGQTCDEEGCKASELHGDTVAIVVADNAGGVPAAIKDRIFEPFFTTKQVGQGTGLGLSISYGIVRDLGGELRVDNEQDGAAFSVVLPASKPSSLLSDA